jgi:hypothetical protein
MTHFVADIILGLIIASGVLTFIYVLCTWDKGDWV